MQRYPDPNVVANLIQQYRRAGEAATSHLDPALAELTIAMSVVRALAAITYDNLASKSGGAVSVEDVAAFIREAPWEESLRVVLESRAGTEGGTPC